MHLKFPFTHVASALIITILCGLVYVTVQQSFRSGANDPQLQIARDIANDLNTNHSTNQLFPKDTIDISKSLALFVVLYNKAGEPIQSNGLLDGNLPKLPTGTFVFTKKNHEDVISWQPGRGVRMAMVIESVQSPNVGFVAAGRSLLEVEKRISNLTKMVFIGWIICIGIIFIHGFLTSYYARKYS